MAAVGNTNLTLLDLATRMQNGSVAKSIVELLSKRNEIIDDAVWVECNDGSSHKTTIRTGLPSATWRQLNYGVAQSKSTTAQVKDACGMIEAYSTIDKALVSLAGDKASFRMSEDAPFIEAVSQSFCDSLIYGNTTLNPERIMGLAPRFNSLSTSTAETADNVISGSGSGSDNTSVWLVVWGENTVHGIYPKGSQAGLQHQDLGEQTVLDAANNPYQALRSLYKWDCGFSVRDWRYIVRIANIDVSDLTKTGSTGADLTDLMVQAMEKVRDLNMGRPAFYCNRTVSSYLRRQMLNKSNLLLSMDQLAGKPVLTFGGVPVRRVDSITNAEATVS